MDTQRVDRYLKQHGGATYGPFYEENRTETQQQHVNSTDDHFVKQNGRTNDVPLYEAKQKREGWTIL